MLAFRGATAGCSALPQQAFPFLSTFPFSLLAVSQRGFGSGGICACDVYVMECFLSPQLQALQSELQFKDVEMNELRTKLQCSERAHKPAVPSTSHGR